jgi:hypothetical protein
MGGVALALLQPINQSEILVNQATSHALIDQLLGIGQNLTKIDQFNENKDLVWLLLSQHVVTPIY